MAPSLPLSGLPAICLSHHQRQQRHLQSLLPPSVQPPALHLATVKSYLDSIPDQLHKFVFLQQLHIINPDTFYMLLIEHTDDVMPIVYTPTVGLACQRWSEIYFHPQGLYVPITAAGHVQQLVDDWPNSQVDAVVFTDGGRILGLGDLAANGMGIPIGKLALYVAFAGINPSRVLPVVLDLGTNNQELLQSKNYIGLRQRRSETNQNQYDEFVGEFLSSIVNRFGRRTLLQFEDFATEDALRLLKLYRHKYMTFNDDVQGTAAMTLAGILSALPMLKHKLHEQTIVFFGAGSSGIGIAEIIAQAMAESGEIKYEDARKRIWAVDSRGLIVSNRPKGGLADFKLPFAHDHEPIDSLTDIIDVIKPSILIGVSSQGGAFSSAILQKLASINEHPVVFALSNPTSKSECSASDAFEQTNGRVLFASGSPFDSVEYNSKVFHPRQANNVYVFPGIGLGALVSGASEISDEMLLAASKALASMVTDEDRAQGSLYPALNMIRSITALIAVAVAEKAFASGLATVPKPVSLHDTVAEAMSYDPTLSMTAQSKL